MLIARQGPPELKLVGSAAATDVAVIVTHRESVLELIAKKARSALDADRGTIKLRNTLVRYWTIPPGLVIVTPPIKRSLLREKWQWYHRDAPSREQYRMKRRLGGTGTLRARPSSGSQQTVESSSRRVAWKGATLERNSEE
ncbi:hypothetical protein Trydic_g7924 [Trypoxylus dichotomus]